MNPEEENIVGVEVPAETETPETPAEVAPETPETAPEPETA